jgi:hypothetical protein
MMRFDDACFPTTTTPTRWEETLGSVGALLGVDSGRDAGETAGRALDLVFGGDSPWIIR